MSQSGWAIREISEVKHYLSICNSAPSEVLSLIALRSKPLLLERTRSILAANEACLRAVMEQHPGLLSWVPPKGGCCGFVRVQLPPGCELSSVAEALVTLHGVLILPGEFFPMAAAAPIVAGAEGAAAEEGVAPVVVVGRDRQAWVNQHFRIGLGRADFPVVLEKFLHALKSVLEQHGA